MFLYLNRANNEKIRITASEGRGSLPNAIIRIQQLTQDLTINLEKENTSPHPERYDEFEIEPEDIEDLIDGDFLYFIYPGDGSDIDPDTQLESGRGRISRTVTETVTVYERIDNPVVYERD